jgi:20S proteasome alpha/beta subunit
MTLVTAAQGKDYVVAGTDSRGTFGHAEVAFSAYDTMQKLVILAPHVIVLTFGAGEIGDNILEEFRREKLQQQGAQLDGISVILQELQMYCHNKWNQQLVNVPFQARPLVGYIVAGLDKNHEDKYNVPRIYSMISSMGFMPALHRYGWANGGIPIYAIYLYGRRYRTQMPIDQLTGLAAYVISETASQDQRVGGPIRMAQVLPEGSKELTDTQIRDLLEGYRKVNP